MRRVTPTTSSPYYSTGGGYTSSTYKRPSRWGFISPQGRNLILLILSGLVIGGIASVIPVSPVCFGDPACYSSIAYLVQFNPLVFSGWVPSLVTSIIVVFPPFPAYGYLGLVDAFFNAISVFWVDGLLRYVYSARQYYVIFLVTGVAGNVISLFAYGNVGIFSFGASGGIFGLVAGALTSDYVANGRLNRGLALWFVLIFIYSSIGGSVDVYAHLGGAAVGLIGGYFAGRTRRRPGNMFY